MPCRSIGLVVLVGTRVPTDRYIHVGTCGCPAAFPETCSLLLLLRSAAALNWIDGLLDGSMGGWMDQVDGWKAGWMDACVMHGWMDKSMDRSIDGASSLARMAGWRAGCARRAGPAGARPPPPRRAAPRRPAGRADCNEDDVPTTALGAFAANWSRSQLYGWI